MSVCVYIIYIYIVCACRFFHIFGRGRGGGLWLEGSRSWSLLRSFPAQDLGSSSFNAQSTDSFGFRCRVYMICTVCLVVLFARGLMGCFNW